MGLSPWLDMARGSLTKFLGAQRAIWLFPLHLGFLFVGVLTIRAQLSAGVYSIFRNSYLTNRCHFGAYLQGHGGQKTGMNTSYRWETCTRTTTIQSRRFGPSPQAIFAHAVRSRTRLGLVPHRTMCPAVTEGGGPKGAEGPMTALAEN